MSNLTRAQIIQLKRDGKTYQEIAGLAGISRQRVHQLISPSKKLKRAIYLRQNGLCYSCNKPVGNSGHYHHLEKKYALYNSPYNIQLLCLSCHLSAHGKSDVKKTCPLCHKQFTVSYKFRNVYNYCSNQCGYTATGIAHRKYEKGIINMTCDCCGKDFIITNSEYQSRIRNKFGNGTNKKWFCSKSCQGSYTAKYHGFGAHPSNIKKKKFDNG